MAEWVAVNHQVRGPSPRLGAKTTSSVTGTEQSLHCCERATEYTYPGYGAYDVDVVKAELLLSV